MNNKPFYLFSTCLLVKGASRSIIYDLQRKSFDYIPHELQEILQDFNGNTLSDVFKYYGSENTEVIEEYFTFLIEREYIYYSKIDKKYFPEYRLKWESPFNISNLIFDISPLNMRFINKVYDEIEMLGTGGISFRFFSVNDYSAYFDSIVTMFSISRCRSIEFFIPYSELIDEKYLDEMTAKNNRIYSFHIYAAPKNNVVVLESIKTPVFYHCEELSSNKDVNYIHKSNFLVSREMFVESNNHNVYFNRKIFIDQHGKIKNAPTLIKDYGNVAVTNLVDVLNNNAFKKYWNIKKEFIEVCNVCEYRHMCVDSRLPVKVSPNIWKVEGSCGYDPYNMKWVNEKK